MKQALSVLFCLLGIISIIRSQETKQAAVEGISTNINIPCNLGRQEAAPLWKINGTLYELTSLPSYIIVDSFSLITIPTVTIDLNDTTYQCVIYDADRPNNLLPGIITRLIVIPGDNRTQLHDADTDKLELNYQQLDIGPVNTTIGWIPLLPNCDTERFFKLQGFTESDVISGHLTAPEVLYNTTSENIIILSSDLTSRTGEALYFRIVATDVNNIVCSSQESMMTFYMFNESQTLQTDYIVPNSSLCFTVPEAIMENAAYMVWPKMLNTKEPDCICLPQMGYFENCSCESDYTVNISSNGSACFYNLTPEMNGTLIHFQYLTDICPLLPDCHINTIVSSYRIIILGSPSTPVITSVNDSICFSAYSNPKSPVLYYNVSITDVTGSQTSLTGIYNSSHCLSLTYELYTDMCGPFLVSVTATNAIGTSDIARIEANILEGQEDCSCYQNRYQINVTTFEVSETTVTISLSCGKDDGFESFILQPQQMHIQIICSGNINISNLQPGMEYSIVKMYYNQTNCTLATFNTSSPTTTTSMPISGQGSEAIKIILPVVIILAFIVSLALIVVYYIKKKACRLEPGNQEQEDHNEPGGERNDNIEPGDE